MSNEWCEGVLVVKGLIAQHLAFKCNRFSGYGHAYTVLLSCTPLPTLLFCNKRHEVMQLVVI